MRGVEKVSIKTDDGVRIVGDFYSGPGSNAILLLHMMPATKESWREFAQMARNNWSLLAIDLRGHGESVEMDGGYLDYNSFSDRQHQESMKDIRAAIDYIKEQDLNAFAIVGASIGSNLALWYQSENPDIVKTVLLSPGFNYHGIETRPLIERLNKLQGVYLVGGSKDARSSGEKIGEMVEVLYKTAHIKNKKYEVLETDKHGTDMFLADSSLKKRIIDWLKAEQ